MPKQTDTVTIREFYIGLESLTDKIMKPINDLANRFDTLESGRLTAVEQKVANIQGRIMYIPILISASISIFSIFVSVFLFISRQ